MDYRIIYSSRKSLAIQITKACEVVVRAPRGIDKTRIENFVRDHEAWINTHLEKQRQFRTIHPEPDESELDRLKDEAKRLIPARVEYFSRIMGVQPVSVSFNKAKTRYGSCSSAGRINFSCRVMRFAPEVIDYVVVHELAHLKHLNHSKAFWAFVEKFIPDYKERKRLLRP